MKKVITIEPAKQVSHKVDLPSFTKRRVAGYARVSTDHEGQTTSYEAQMKYYTDYINSRSDWEFVKMYSDEGISGTNTKARIGFQRMVEDALDGKIDLILTKSSVDLPETRLTPSQRFGSSRKQELKSILKRRTFGPLILKGSF